MQSVSVEVALDHLELGRLYFKICDFSRAIGILREGLQQSRVDKDWDKYVQYFPLLMRIYSERMEIENIDELRDGLRFLPKHLLTSKIHYTLGIAASYEAEFDRAQSQFQEAEALAGHLLDQLHAQFGRAACLFKKEQASESLRLLNYIENSLRESLFVDLKIATLCLSAHVLMKVGDLKSAGEKLRLAETHSRIEQNLFMSLNVLFAQALLHKASGQIQEATLCLEMLESLMNPQDLKHMSMQTQKLLVNLKQGPQKSEFVIFENQSQDLLHPEKGLISTGRQHILVRLFKYLAEGEKVGRSKEEIVQFLWKEEYHPLHHDNKIYVTIKRLRRIIEPNEKRPQYILSSPEGYRLRSDVHLKIQA